MAMNTDLTRYVSLRSHLDDPDIFDVLADLDCAVPLGVIDQPV